MKRQAERLNTQVEGPDAESDRVTSLFRQARSHMVGVSTLAIRTTRPAVRNASGRMVSLGRSHACGAACGSGIVGHQTPDVVSPQPMVIRRLRLSNADRNSSAEATRRSGVPLA